MPKIVEYSAPDRKLLPSEAGFQAAETAGRRLGPLYREIAADIKEGGRIQAQVNEQRKWPYDILALQQKMQQGGGFVVHGLNPKTPKPFNEINAGGAALGKMADGLIGYGEVPSVPVDKNGQLIGSLKSSPFPATAPQRPEDPRYPGMGIDQLQDPKAIIQTIDADHPGLIIVPGGAYTPTSAAMPGDNIPLNLPPFPTKDVNTEIPIVPPTADQLQNLQAPWDTSGSWFKGLSGAPSGGDFISPIGNTNYPSSDFENFPGGNSGLYRNVNPSAIGDALNGLANWLGADPNASSNGIDYTQGGGTGGM